MGLDDCFWQDFLALHQLPEAYRGTAEQWFVPLLDDIRQRRSSQRLAKAHPPPLILGLQGCQGSGKSTFASFLQGGLCRVAGLKILCLSLDDFYYPRADRLRLAREVHPLFETRGVPGTHDIELLQKLLRQLSAGSPGPLLVPRFDKARDDRRQDWDTVDPTVLDIVLLEGWCVGTPPQPGEALLAPINALEAEEDPQGAWRQRVNEHLAGPYAETFDLVETLIVFVAPDFTVVSDWRWEQEQKLLAQATSLPAADRRPIKKEGLQHFLQFYQRLTEWSFKTMPGRADVCFQLDRDRTIVNVSTQRPPASPEPTAD